MTVSLVTGGHGFVGTHLCRLLRDAGWDVVSMGRRDVPSQPRERYVHVDLTDADAVTRALDAVRPEFIFHLAASSPQKTPDARQLVTDAVAGTLSLSAALRDLGLKPRVVLAGSSAQYGVIPRRDNPITEDMPCRPVRAYGWAKLAAEATAFALAAEGGFEVIAARAFNHVGPGEPPVTVAGSFAERVAAVLAGRAERVVATDLAVVRDFSDVRDIAAGYLDLAQRGIAGRTYNLCSGRATSVEEILDGLLTAAGLDRSIVDAQHGTPAEPRYQVGSPRRVHQETGWQAVTPLATSLEDLLASVTGALASDGDLSQAN